MLNADAEREFEPAFASLTAKRASALVVAAIRCSPAAGPG